MSSVLDASVVVSALAGPGDDARWARAKMQGSDLLGPHLMPAEVSNLIRRSLAAGLVDQPAASRAHDDLVRLNVELFPFAPLAERVWDLRNNLTSYDGWYVALAEALDARLVTLDRRLARAPGIRCPVDCPPST